MERFPSQRDGWLTGVLLAGFGVSCLAAAAVLLAPHGQAPGLGWVAGILLASAVFVAWIWSSTWYGVTTTDLLIRSGPFRWRVPLEDIQEVKPSRNPLSSPALSLDRLEIRYGRNAMILISPRDRARFLQTLVARSPRLALQGDRATRSA